MPEMTPPTDDTLATVIDHALAVDTAFARLPAQLVQPYFESLDQLYRQTTRVAVALFTFIFDLFLFSQYRATPELVPISAFLRLAVFTPAVLLFFCLDRPHRPMKRRAYELFLLALAVMPGVFSAIICVHTTSPNSMSDVRATSLILLVVGLIFRMRLPFVVLTAVISCAAYFTGLLLAPIIPRAEIPAVIMTELSIAAAVIVFTALLDRRDRMVFLLHLREQVRARALAVQNQGLRRKVDTDALTGLANRGCLDATLASLWASSRLDATPLSLIMIDIDHFKRFNDHYGHQGGDDCLRRVARRVLHDMRDNDLVARYGGEEFAVILPDTKLSAAGRVAERLCEAVSGLAIPHEGVGAGCTVTISLGVASAMPGEGTPASLIEAADRRLYAAKRAGRNRAFSVDPEYEAEGRKAPLF